MKTNTYIIDDENIGQRLDKWLANQSEISSRSYAKDLIEKNLVLVNGKSDKPSLILKKNDRIEISFPDITKNDQLVPFDYKLDIIFEDKDLIVINKPSGLVVHPAAGHENDTLVNALINYTQELSMKNEMRPGIVHRLDKETSGLLVVAKNDLAHDHLAAQFKNKTSHRIYYAVVEKELKNQTGKIQSYLSRHPVDRKRHASVRLNNKIVSLPNMTDVDGKWAVTHYQKLATTRVNKNLIFNYIKLKLETGRTHQIRVHLSDLGHPLVGDLTYGFSKNIFDNLKLNRFFLHAAELGFIHPTTNESMLFKVPWPISDSLKIQEFGFANTLSGM